jgi:hypothetical protein
LVATVWIRARNEENAFKQLAEAFKEADCNGGCWRDGEPILFTASIRGQPELIDEDEA